MKTLLIKISAVIALSSILILAFCSCEEELLAYCYAGLLDNSAPKVARDLMECEYGICISSEVPKTKQNPEGGFSVGYCTKPCESNMDCREGWLCEVIIPMELVEDMAARGYEPKFAGKTFCRDPNAKSPTEDEIKTAQLRYAEDKYASYAYSCGLEKEENKSDACPEALAGFCSQREVVEAKEEYMENCCDDVGYVKGFGASYCCGKHPPVKQTDLCCQSQTYLVECIKDPNCKTSFNAACGTNY